MLCACHNPLLQSLPRAIVRSNKTEQLFTLRLYVSFFYSKGIFETYQTFELRTRPFALPQTPPSASPCFLLLLHCPKSFFLPRTTLVFATTYIIEARNRRHGHGRQVSPSFFSGHKSRLCQPARKFRGLQLATLSSISHCEGGSTAEIQLTPAVLPGQLPFNLFEDEIVGVVYITVLTHPLTQDYHRPLCTF